jgi:hypothetical protein
MKEATKAANDLSMFRSLSTIEFNAMGVRSDFISAAQDIETSLS